MKKLKFSSYVYAALMLALSLSSCKNWSETGTGSLRIITNKDGQTLGYDTTSGVKILTVRRLGAEERAKDLASKMTVEQIAGLMLYSAHQGCKGREIQENCEIKYNPSTCLSIGPPPL